MKPLHSHMNNPSQQHIVSVDYHLQKDVLKVHFTVEFSKLYVSNAFSMDTFENWGLWETDVVELFVTRSLNRTPYLELQLSPLGQKFALVVESPRAKFSYPQKLDLKVSSHLDPKRWDGEFYLPYDQIPGNSSDIYGNFHACLGHARERSYFAYQVNDESTPDFHRPDLFTKLGGVPC